MRVDQIANLPSDCFSMRHAMDLAPRHSVRCVTDVFAGSGDDMPYNSRPYRYLMRPRSGRLPRSPREPGVCAAMPTPSHDPSAAAVNPIDEAVKLRSRRIVGASLGATLVTMVVLFAAMALAPVDAKGATCTLTSTNPTTNWSDTLRWSGCSG